MRKLTQQKEQFINMARGAQGTVLTGTGSEDSDEQAEQGTITDTLGKCGGMRSPFLYTHVRLCLGTAVHSASH